MQIPIKYSHVIRYHLPLMNEIYNKIHVAMVQADIDFENIRWYYKYTYEDLSNQPIDFSSGSVNIPLDKIQMRLVAVTEQEMQFTSDTTVTPIRQKGESKLRIV